MAETIKNFQRQKRKRISVSLWTLQMIADHSPVIICEWLWYRGQGQGQGHWSWRSRPRPDLLEAMATTFCPRVVREVEDNPRGPHHWVKAKDKAGNHKNTRSMQK